MSHDTQSLLKKGRPGRSTVDPGAKSAFSVVVKKRSLALKQGDGPHAHAVAPGDEVTSSWLDASFIILGEILGTGVLGMPKVVASLGLGAGLGCIVLFGTCGLYSGMLVSRTRTMLQQRPDGPLTVHSFGEAAAEIVGPKFGAFSKYAILVNWVLILPYYVMASSKSVMIALEALWGIDVCYYSASAFVCLGLFPLMQVQSLARLKGLALASTIAIVTVLCLVVYYIWSQDQDVLAVLNATPAEMDTVGSRRLLGSHGTNENAEFQTTLGQSNTEAVGKAEVLPQLIDGVNSMSNVMFAYQGQSMFFEIMGEMRNPQTFSKSVYFSNFVMISVYAGISTLVVLTVSASLGASPTSKDVADAVPGFLPSLLVGNFGRTIVSLLLTFHIAVSFLITNQPLTDKLHMWLFDRPERRRQVLAKESLPQGKPVWNRCGCASGRRALTWGGVTFVILIISYLICNLVPFFADFQAIIGSLMGGSIMFGWPSIFFLVESRNFKLDRAGGSQSPSASGSATGDVNGPTRTGLQSWFCGAGASASTADVILCLFLLFIVVPTFAVGGLVSSLTSLVEHWEDFGRPFDCIL